MPEKKVVKMPKMRYIYIIRRNQNICVDSKGKCLIKYEKLIKAAIHYLNQYRKNSYYMESEQKHNL